MTKVAWKTPAIFNDDVIYAVIRKNESVKFLDEEPGNLNSI